MDTNSDPLAMESTTHDAMSIAGVVEPAQSAKPQQQPTKQNNHSGNAESGLVTENEMTGGNEEEEKEKLKQKVSDGDYIKKIVNETVQEVIQDSPYSHEATNSWTNKIVESLVRLLVQIDRDNKYIVTCMIVQNLHQGMRSATSCFWNAQTDTGYSLT